MKKSQIKIGDYLYCHTKLVMKDILLVALTVGKKYKVIGVDMNEEEFQIINDYHEEHTFSFCEDYHSYYKQWFDELRIQRKLKLKKIINFQSI